MAGRTEKRLLSFSSGLMGPEEQGRVDLAKAQAALRKAENFIIEPYGLLTRRPGLQVVANVKGNFEFTGGGSGTIPFIEVPVYTGYCMNGGSAPEAWAVIEVYMRGKVRCYQDGTIYFKDVQFYVFRRTSAPSYKFYVWVGTAPNSGELVELYDHADPFAVWSDPQQLVLKLGTNQKLYFLCGDLTTHHLDKVELIKYPGGWSLPKTIYLSSTRDNPLSVDDSYHFVTIARDSNSNPTQASIAGKYFESNSTGYAQSFQVAADWTESDWVTYFNQTAARDYQLSPYAESLPSVESGKGIVFVVTLGRSVSNAVRGVTYLGPFYRTVPALQYGVPPFVNL